jgi:hypothetical protein
MYNCSQKNEKATHVLEILKYSTGRHRTPQPLIMLVNKCTSETRTLKLTSHFLYPGTCALVVCIAYLGLTGWKSTNSHWYLLQERDSPFRQDYWQSPQKGYCGLALLVVAPSCLDKIVSNGSKQVLPKGTRTVSLTSLKKRCYEA